MKNIRQRNDIDVVVQLKNNEGVALDPTLCSDMTVYLTCGTKKFYINDFEKHADGHIKFRFHAEQQAKLGVHNVTISAVTEDGRTFTTDACNAFNLVACSCNASDDAGEVNVESVEVDATFEISAWGMVSDIVTYDVTELWNSVEPKENREPVELNVDLINKVFGSPDSLMYNLENKHVRFTIFSEGSVASTDVTSSITIGETEGYLSLTHEFGALGEAVLTCGYLFTFDKTEEPHMFTNGQLVQYTDADQITTDFIVDEAITTEKIADKAITRDKIADGVLPDNVVADVGITGTLNVTDQNSIAAAQDLITKPYGVAFYLITDSNGRLPSKNQEAVHISASIEKLLSFRSPNTAVNNILNQVSIDNFKPRGFNVGDIIALSRVPVSIDALVEYLGLSSAIATALKLLGLSEIEIYQYKIWTTNDAKWSNFQNKDGSVVPTGVKGLMSVWDKEQVDKVPRLEANDLSTKYGYGTNFDDCLTTGVCAYSPANIGGVTENFTLIVQASSTVDSGGFYSIIQTAYGRTGSVYNRIFKRMIFYNPTTSRKELHAWVEITSSNVGSTKYFTTNCAPNVIFSTLETAKVNGFAEVSSETEDTAIIYTFKGYFNYVPTDGSPYYMGVGMITYSDDLSEPAIMIAHPYNPTQIIGATRITALEARIKALEDKLG